MLSDGAVRIACFHRMTTLVPGGPSSGFESWLKDFRCRDLAVARTLTGHESQGITCVMMQEVLMLQHIFESLKVVSKVKITVKRLQHAKGPLTWCYFFTEGNRDQSPGLFVF